MTNKRRDCKYSPAVALEITLNEYMVACYGASEYSEDILNIRLRIEESEVKTIDYVYMCRKEGRPYEI